MSIFKRSGEVNNKLSQWFNKAGWLSMGVNMITLTWFFWGKYSEAFWLIRFSGCIAVSALVLGIEFAALSVLFEPSVLEELMGQNKSGNNIADAIATFGIIIVCGLSGLAFWYDWTINNTSFGLKTPNLDYQVLAGVVVFISEIFFWIANVCQISASKSSSKSTPRSGFKPAPK
jgi:hypothetical protein